MRSPFWQNPVKAESTAKAAAEVGAAYVDAGPGIFAIGYTIGTGSVASMAKAGADYVNFEGTVPERCGIPMNFIIASGFVQV